MRFMVIVKGDKNSEAGLVPSDETMLKEMGKFNEELVKAGVMLAGEGLHPTSKGVKVRFTDKKPVIIDGPFTEAKEIVAGYWLWQVRSKEEAIDWIKRAPFGPGAEVELRQVYETEEFASVDPTGEIRAQDAALRKKVEAQRS